MLHWQLKNRTKLGLFRPRLYLTLLLCLLQMFILVVFPSGQKANIQNKNKSKETRYQHHRKKYILLNTKKRQLYNEIHHKYFKSIVKQQCIAVRSIIHIIFFFSTMKKKIQLSSFKLKFHIYVNKELEHLRSILNIFFHDLQIANKNNSLLIYSAANSFLFLSNF